MPRSVTTERWAAKSGHTALRTARRRQPEAIASAGQRCDLLPPSAQGAEWQATDLVSRAQHFKRDRGSETLRPERQTFGGVGTVHDPERHRAWPKFSISDTDFVPRPKCCGGAACGPYGWSDWFGAGVRAPPGGCARIDPGKPIALFR